VVSSVAKGSLSQESEVKDCKAQPNPKTISGMLQMK
jgi:hypothetical protein